MNPELTPEQKQQLGSWAAQRDSILSEISVLRTTNDRLTSENKALAESSKDIHERLNQAIGRLDELNKKEKEKVNVLSTEVADLIAKKSELQAEVFGIEKEIQLLKTHKDSHKEAISTLSETHGKVFDSTANLHKAMGDSAKINADNIKQIENLLVTLKGTVQEMVDINGQNVAKANYVITELPRLFFELQKIVLNRKRI